MTEPESPFPSPCDKCAFDSDRCTAYRTCNSWRTWFFWHWKRFNAYAKAHNIQPATPPQPAEEELPPVNPGGYMTLRQARNAAGLSQKALAEELGVSCVRISRWEKKVATPSPENFRKLCHILNADPKKLII